jgi:hypothetical protein
MVAVQVSVTVASTFMRAHCFVPLLVVSHACPEMRSRYKTYLADLPLLKLVSITAVLVTLRKCGRTAGSLRKLVCITAVLMALPERTSRTAVALDQLVQITAVLVTLRERRRTAGSLVDLVGVDIREVVG